MSTTNDPPPPKGERELELERGAALAALITPAKSRSHILVLLSVFGVTVLGAVAAIVFAARSETQGAAGGGIVIAAVLAAGTAYKALDEAWSPPRPDVAALKELAELAVLVDGEVRLTDAGIRCLGAYQAQVPTHRPRQRFLGRHPPQSGLGRSDDRPQLPAADRSSPREGKGE